jgi:hypothetical protein
VLDRESREELGMETWLSLLYSLLAEKTIDVLISSVFVSSLVFCCASGSPTDIATRGLILHLLF